MFDAVDRKILQALQIDGTLSQTTLAERVGASAASCWRRVKALEAAGALRQIVRLVDAEAVGLTVNVLCHLRLKNHLPESTIAFEGFISSCPEIIECFAMSGDWDYLLRVVAKDIASYEHFLRNHILTNESVGAVSSSFALSLRKYTTALPV